MWGWLNAYLKNTETRDELQLTAIQNPDATSASRTSS